MMSAGKEGTLIFADLHSSRVGAQPTQTPASQCNPDKRRSVEISVPNLHQDYAAQLGRFCSWDNGRGRRTNRDLDTAVAGIG